VGEQKTSCSAESALDGKQKIFFDSLGKKAEEIRSLDLPMARFVLKYKKSSVLFSPDGRTESFFTSDSKLYYTPEELRALRRGARIIRMARSLDGLAKRAFGQDEVRLIAKESFISKILKEKYLDLRNRLEYLARDSVNGMSFARMYNATIVGSVVFGMLLMTMIYRNLGQGVSAKIEETKLAQIAEEARVLGAET
jgi:hypothetical protein